MDEEVVQAFNKALVSMHDCKGGQVSKQTVVEITKAAINALHYFKHVVFLVEKYLAKCRQDYKLPILYIIDSILRQAKKQYQHKDVFAPRFSINLQNTIANILTCDHADRLKVVRVINLWRVHKIFSEETIDSLLQFCRASGLEVDGPKVEVLVKGDNANVGQYSSNLTQSNPDASFTSSIGESSFIEQMSIIQKGFTPKTTPTKVFMPSIPRTPPIPRPPTPVLDKSFESDDNVEEMKLSNYGISIQDALTLISSDYEQLGTFLAQNPQALQRAQKFLNERMQEKLEIDNRRQGNIKNILSREFDYSDDEEEESSRVVNEASLQALSRDQIFSMAQSLLSDADIRQEINEFCKSPKKQKLLVQQQLVVPPSSTVAPLSFPPNFSVPPPSFASGAFQPAPIGMLPTSIPNFSPNVPPPGFTSLFPSTALGYQVTQNSQQDSKKENSLDRRERKRERSLSRPRSREDRDFRTTDVKRRERDRRDDSYSKSRERKDQDRDRRNRDRERDRGDRNGKRPIIDDITQRRGEESRNGAKVEEDKDLEKERRRNGIPSKPKSDHALVASRTIWFGRIPTTCYESDIQQAIKDTGVAEKINIVAPRGCAYVTMSDRRSAFKIMDRMSNNLQVCKKSVKLDWAQFQGLKESENDKLVDYWDSNRGIAQIPYSKLPEKLDQLLEGAWLDVDTLPPYLKGLYDNKGPKYTTPQHSSVQTINLPLNPSINLQQTATAATLLATQNFGSAIPTNATASMFAAAAFLPQFTIPQPGMAMPPLTGAGITMPILPFAPNTSTFATGQMNRGSQNPPISIPQPRFTQSRMHGESRSDFRPRTNQYSDGFNAPRDVGRGRGNWRNDQPFQSRGRGGFQGRPFTPFRPQFRPHFRPDYAQLHDINSRPMFGIGHQTQEPPRIERDSRTNLDSLVSTTQQAIEVRPHPKNLLNHPTDTDETKVTSTSDSHQERTKESEQISSLVPPGMEEN